MCALTHIAHHLLLEGHALLAAVARDLLQDLERKLVAVRLLGQEFGLLQVGGDSLKCAQGGHGHLFKHFWVFGLKLVVLELRVVYVLEPSCIQVLSALTLAVNMAMRLKVLAPSIESVHRLVLKLEEPRTATPMHFDEYDLAGGVHRPILFNVKIQTSLQGKARKFEHVWQLANLVRMVVLVYEVLIELVRVEAPESNLLRGVIAQPHKLITDLLFD